MNIKVASIEDAENISHLIQENTEFNPNNYSIAQIDAWKAYNTPTQIEKQLKERKVFCAFEKEELFGTIALKGNCILGFYVRHSLRGKGIGSILLGHLESYANSEQIKKLYLTSTPSAYNFYQNKGYIAAKEVVLSINEVEFNEIEMVKSIED